MYPEVTALLLRDPIEMTWTEYGSYLVDNGVDLTEQQCYILAGTSYRITDETIANALETTPSVISTQRSRIDLSRRGDLDEKKHLEVHQSAIPATPFRHIGSVEYWHADCIEESTSCEADIFVSVDGSEYIWVRETRSEADEIDEDSPLAVEVSRSITEDKVYRGYSTFTAHSRHSPSRVTPDGFHITTEGTIYDESKQTHDESKKALD